MSWQLPEFLESLQELGWSGTGLLQEISAEMLLMLPTLGKVRGAV